MARNEQRRRRRAGSTAPDRGRGGGEAVRTRDHLANTRTLLSWFRSGVLLLALGFAVAKFSVLAGKGGGAQRLGLAVVMLGLVLMGAALGRFLQQRGDIERSDLHVHKRPDLVLLLAASAAGAALVYLVSR